MEEDLTVSSEEIEIQSSKKLKKKKERYLKLNKYYYVPYFDIIFLSLFFIDVCLICIYRTMMCSIICLSCLSTC